MPRVVRRGTFLHLLSRGVGGRYGVPACMFAGVERLVRGGEEGAGEVDGRARALRPAAQLRARGADMVVHTPDGTLVENPSRARGWTEDSDSPYAKKLDF